MSRAAYLILENGTVFEGKAFGAEKETTGELVFTTAMTGYLETLTDPSYYGQVVIQTFPLIGNYGVIPADFESDSPSLKGYIVREWCQVPSSLPLIVTDSGGMVELVDEDCAIIIKRNENIITQLKDAMINLLNNKRKCQLMGEAARKRSTLFSDLVYSKKFMDLIDN